LDAITDPRRLSFASFAARLLPGDTIPAAIASIALGLDHDIPKPVTQPRSEWPDLGHARLGPAQRQVALLEGCAMKTLFPRVQEATRRLLRRVGIEAVSLKTACCGALHAHSGRLIEGTRMAAAIAGELRGQTLVVNSAGCGSHLKDLGQSGEVSGLAGCVQDASEFLLANGLKEAVGGSRGLFQDRLDRSLRVTYHDACHLRHGQKIHSQPRELLRAIPGIEILELAEADLCCGSAGTYNLLQPEMANRLLERKLGHIEDADPDIVVLGNPGCHAWIAYGLARKSSPIRVFHLAELLESSFSGLPESDE
jgi:glycolate oxidase iron-sulfur subunit